MKKTIYSLIISTALLASCGGNAESHDHGTESTVNTEVVSNASVDLNIEGMACAHNCAGLIQKEVAAMPGVKSCEVDFDNKTATIEFNDQDVNSEAILAKINGLNDGAYKAEVKKEEEKEEVDHEVEEAIETVEALNAVHMSATQLLKVKNIMDIFKSAIIDLK